MSDAVAKPMTNPYETDKLLGEYLLFHYGEPAELLPYDFGPRDALDFPAHCAQLCLSGITLPPGARALDIGCAVGRSSFELARQCSEVIGIDFSQRFIDAANALKNSGELEYRRLEEGARFTPTVAKVPAEIDRERVRFETGDAMNLRSDLGKFDIVLAANLLCRLPAPAKFLARLPDLVKPGARLVFTTPCTWLEEYTPQQNWLCDEHSTTLDGLHRHLDPDFSLQLASDLPFLIREHARKFQWTVARASVWIRK
ncbi:MAG: putative 4-mercaptohistidine N1-methyltransferase [Verrucomicrobiota bacterium]